MHSPAGNSPQRSINAHLLPRPSRQYRRNDRLWVQHLTDKLTCVAWLANFFCFVINTRPSDLRRRCFVCTMPWWCLCAIWRICLRRQTGTTMRYPCRTSWSTRDSSELTALKTSWQSNHFPYLTHLQRHCCVSFCADASSRICGGMALGTAFFATQYAQSCSMLWLGTSEMGDRCDSESAAISFPGQ